MKSAQFAYRRVDTVDEAVELLAQLGDDAKLLAGGQSLAAMMNLRVARPRALVDVSRVAALDYVCRDADGLRVGALTPHVAVERSAPGSLGGGREALRFAARWIGHLPIRIRGTFGGSIAHADPAAEWCVMARALDAVMVARNAGGERRIAADAFFAGYMSTALAPDEMLTEVRFERAWSCAALAELAQRSGDFGIVVAAVALALDDGVVRTARVVVGGVEDVPVRVPDAEEALVGTAADVAARDAASQLAAEGVQPHSDTAASSAYRRRLTAVLVRRAASTAIDGAAA